MGENRVDVTLSEEALSDITTAIETLRQKLPFLLSLTAEERRALPKMGDKSRAFVEKALEAAHQYPDCLPRSFDVEAFKRDVTLYSQLASVAMSLTQLTKMLDDTLLEVGSESYAAALVTYQSLKQSGNASLDPIVDDLAKRFATKAG